MESTIVNKEELEFLTQESSNDVDQAKTKFVAGPARIISVPPWSLAAEMELEVGDQITEINGKKLRDIMDFQFEFAKSDDVTLVIKKVNGDIETVEFDKDPEEELGAEFETPLFNGVQECANKCAFCFIDQQPMDMTRKSLHLKDDDFRLSYLHGSYVTLTNLSRSDRRRIEELRPGPLYVSVHATDPDLRNELLGRKNSTPIIEELKWLESLGIPCHTQIVLCPGLNDGEHLINTLNELYALKDSPVVSAAIVPVGLTKYHNGGLKRFGLDDALETIAQIEEWQKDHPKFAYLSDEFYLMTHNPVPDYESMGEYPQLEDGVGVTTLFLHEFSQEVKKLKGLKLDKPTKFTWINGTIGKAPLTEIARQVNENVENLELNLACLDSEFWGITNVTGLLTGQDILDGLKKYSKENDLGDYLIIPSVTLKDNEDVFLDDMKLEELEKAIGVPCIKAWGAEEFTQIFTNLPS